MHSKVSPYNIVSFVFHNQSDSIEENLQAMDVHHLHNLGYPGHCIYTESIIRGEEVYETMSLEDRRKLFDAISLFTRKSHIRGKTFYEKKHFSDKLPPPLSEPSTANQSPSCLTFPFLPSSIGKSTLFPSLFQPQV